MGRPRKHEIELTEAERDSLRDLRSRTAPHGLVRRARIVLASAEGASRAPDFLAIAGRHIRHQSY
jgi:hypothetical protein